MYTIQNEFLKVNFQAKGAELTSIVNLKFLSKFPSYQVNETQ